LMRQLLGMVGARTPLEDNPVIRIDHVQVADSTTGDPVDVARDELGKFEMVFADPESPQLCPGVVHRHASLPLARLCGLASSWPEELPRTDCEGVGVLTPSFGNEPVLLGSGP